MSFSPTRPSTARSVLRYLTLLTAVANAGGNVVILLFYRPIFALLHVPLPKDLFSFVFVSCFSFTVGVLAYLVFRSPEKSQNLLVIGCLGKAAYSAATAYFFYEADLHWFYRVFGLWDGAFAAIFLLFLIHLASTDITRLNQGEILAGLPRTRARRALMLGHSLTGNGKAAMDRVRTGLTRRGYSVEERTLVPTEQLFHFPFSFLEFLRIMLRAIFRRPTTIEPLDIPPDHPYDLIVVTCQTWFLGMGAPTQALFQEPRHRALFAGRDCASVTVCRGLWRRTQAMAVRGLESCGAKVVGARAYTNPGPEPARTFSLFVFLGAGAPGRPAWLRRWLQPQYVSTEALAELEQFGEQLAMRPRASEVALETSTAPQEAHAQHAFASQQ
jgi:hypothetical protein